MITSPEYIKQKAASEEQYTRKIVVKLRKQAVRCGMWRKEREIMFKAAQLIEDLCTERDVLVEMIKEREDGRKG